MPSAQHRRGFCKQHLLPAGLQGPSPGWGWGRRCGGLGECLPSRRSHGAGRDPGNVPNHAVLGIWLCFLQGFQNPLAVWRCAVPTSQQSVMFLASRILVSFQCQPFGPWGAGRAAESVWGLWTLWRPGQRSAMSWRVKGHVGLWLNVTESSCSSGRIITIAY